MYFYYTYNKIIYFSNYSKLNIRITKDTIFTNNLKTYNLLYKYITI